MQSVLQRFEWLTISPRTTSWLMTLFYFKNIKNFLKIKNSSICFVCHVITLFFIETVYEKLVYEKLVYKKLVYKKLVYQKLVYKKLVYKKLVYKKLVYKKLVL